MNDMPTKIEDNFGKALAYLMTGVAAGLALDVCAKKLLEVYSIPQFIFLRSAIGILVFLIAARWYGGIGSLKTNRWKWHGLRTILATGAMFGFFFGLSRMPLVDTLTIVFVAPLIMTALSVHREGLGKKQTRSSLRHRSERTSRRRRLHATPPQIEIRESWCWWAARRAFRANTSTMAS